MSTIPLGISHYTRTLGKTPQILLINMLLEKDPANPVDGLVRLQRAGLELFAALGVTGPARGIFRQPGTFNGDWLVVSGTTLYRVTASGVATAFFGSVPGTALVTMAANAKQLVIATGGTCYRTGGDGVTVLAVAMPDGESVSSVAHINGYFILTVADSDRFYWIIPGATNPDALDFASAESAPDNIVCVKRLFDELWFFGESTTEVWQTTGDADAPFQRIAGRLYEKGCANAHAVCTTDNTIFWVGDDLTVDRGDAQPVRVSDHAIEEALRLNGSDDLRAWSFYLDGHTFYVLRIGDSGTYVYDVENPNWMLWKTYGRSVWQAHVGSQAGNIVIAGDDTTGELWRLDPTRSNDGGFPLVREILGGVPWAGSKPLKCKSVSLFVATGWAATGTEPMLELTTSDDGVTFQDPWIPISIGKQGKYGTEVVARQLGIINAPGRLFAVRMTEDTLFRISYAKMNEA